jgi:hypothetical protein
MPHLPRALLPLISLLVCLVAAGACKFFYGPSWLLVWLRQIIASAHARSEEFERVFSESTRLCIAHDVAALVAGSTPSEASMAALLKLWRAATTVAPADLSPV